MITYLKNHEIEKSKWDACIKESVNGMIYAMSWYLDIVAEDWDALVEDDYERVFPLTYGKKWGIDYLFQPVFTQQLGLFSKNALSEEVVNSFLDSIPTKYKFAEINLNTFNKVTPNKYNLQEWHTYELDLIHSYSHIVKNYSTNQKRKLKKAGQANLSLVKNTKPDEIIKLFRDNRGKNISSLLDEDYVKLHRIAYSGIYKGVIQTYSVYSENNQLCAAVIFARSKSKMIFLFSGLSEEGKQTNAMAYLINSFIKEHSQQNLTLDFEGSNDPNLARFYKSFGSKLCTYPHIIINRLPFYLNIPFQLIKRIKS